jgi:S-adenosylmethionine hydrolase
MTRPILFLSDFGLEDEYVGVCHAVIERFAPGATVIDLTHGVPPGDIAGGALALATAVPYAPADAVYLAVVDPGVGTSRRAVVVAAGEAALVGPDNGLLALAARALGGARAAVALDSIRMAPWPVSATFHGRDVFAPAAARVAAGATIEELGEAIDVAGLIEVAAEAPLVEPGRLTALVVGVDRFGNLRLGAGPDELERAGLSRERSLRLGPSPITTLRRVATYGELANDELGLLVDSAGRLAIVCNLERAAERLALGRGDHAVIARTDHG